MSQSVLHWALAFSGFGALVCHRFVCGSVGVFVVGCFLLLCILCGITCLLVQPSESKMFSVFVSKSRTNSKCSLTQFTWSSFRRWLRMRLHRLNSRIKKRDWNFFMVFAKLALGALKSIKIAHHRSGRKSDFRPTASVQGGERAQEKDT